MKLNLKIIIQYILSGCYWSCHYILCQTKMVTNVEPIYWFSVLLTVSASSLANCKNKQKRQETTQYILSGCYWSCHYILCQTMSAIYNGRTNIHAFRIMYWIIIFKFIFLALDRHKNRAGGVGMTNSNRTECIE
jgi:glucose uptake protein GlcU